MKLRRLFWLFPLLLIFLVAVAIHEEFSKGNNDYQRIEISNYDTDPTLSREERNLWSENPRDENWQVYRSPEVNEVFNYSKQKAVVASNTANINPYIGLTASGVTPMFSTENGVALWPNCHEIKVSTGIDFFLTEVEEMYDVIDGVTEIIRAYSGLVMTHSLRTTGNHPVYGPSLISTVNLPVPEKNSIFAVWVQADSPHLSPDELGTAEIWHKIEADGTPTITRARIVLSEKLFQEYGLGLIGRGSNIETAVLHEFVHAVGIGHSTNKNSFMYLDLADDSFLTIADLAALIFAGSRSC